jgi:hypothetical protein
LPKASTWLPASTIPISSSVSPYSRAPVDLPVRGLDAAQQGGLLVRCAGFGELFVQGEHLLHQGDHTGALGRRRRDWQIGKLRQKQLQ